MAGSLNTSAEYNYQNAFGSLFVMLIGAIVFLFTLRIQCLCENENTAKRSGSKKHNWTAV